MNPNSPIIVVDDDQDDLDFVAAAHEELGIPNPLITFLTPLALIDYLNSKFDYPFLILCDLNLGVMNGIELKRRLSADEHDRFQSIPFVLWSTGAESNHVRQAFKNEVQGFFLKPSSFTALVDTYHSVIKYWQLSMHPEPIG